MIFWSWSCLIAIVYHCTNDLQFISQIIAFPLIIKLILAFRGIGGLFTHALTSVCGVTMAKSGNALSFTCGIAISSGGTGQALFEPFGNVFLEGDFAFVYL